MGKISLQEVAQGKDIPSEYLGNIETLLHRLNLFRELYGQPMSVTSGFRSMEDHLRIYREKGITDPSKIPMNSAHLTGQACDFADPKGVLKSWIRMNPTILDTCNLYQENPTSTVGWIHLDTRPRVTRVFNP